MMMKKKRILNIEQGILNNEVGNGNEIGRR